MFKNWQTYLTAARKKLASAHHVQVALKPELENEYDKNAISVLLDYGCGWKVVGYIARELTSYFTPLINSNSIKVTIARIRFRVNCFLIGYYLTINITRKGMWCPKVISASKKVT